MKFYSIYKKSEKRKFLYPCIKLDHIVWDDYGCSTKFSMTFYRNSKDFESIGIIKIMSNEEEYVKLPTSFDKLSKKYCSLGQNVQFYENIKSILPANYDVILKSLRDVVSTPILVDEFQEYHAFESSLLRSNMAKEALRTAHAIFDDKKKVEENIKFGFRTRVPGAFGSHDITISFSTDETFKRRIFALIGKNGTGKTQYLASLAATLRGVKGKGNFTKKEKSFSRVLAISYTLFDQFEDPNDFNSESQAYIFCGLKESINEKRPQSLRRDFLKSLTKIKKLSRDSEWVVVLRKIVKVPFEDFYNSLRNHEAVLSKYSSGQTLLIMVLSDIISNIQDGSILLFDEPETHLHPEAITDLMSSISKLLKMFNSYAVLTTHSALIIQGLLSKSVKVIEKDGKYPIIKDLKIESFGENLTLLTSEVFGVSYRDSLFKRNLIEMKERLTKEEVIEFFGNNLSFNARAFIESIF